MSGIGLNGKDHQPNHGNQELATPGFPAIGMNKTKDGADHGTQELVTPESLTATGMTAIGMNKMRSSMEIRAILLLSRFQISSWMNSMKCFVCLLYILGDGV